MVGAHELCEVKNIGEGELRGWLGEVVYPTEVSDKGDLVTVF